MLLNVLSRRGDGCRAMQRLLRDCHEPEAAKPALRRRAWQLFRALVARRVVEFVPRTEEGAKLRVNVDLQDDFSMDQTLSLYLIETLPLLDAESPDYALDVLTLVESILENPELILRKQLDRIKDRAVAQMKADGVEYEQRMEELEKLEYPKPLRDFVYETFNAFADRHPWVGEENIRPKSIAREMFENFRSFAEYVLDYELQRSEGLLLRHLNSVYKVLSQTVPDGVKTDEVTEMELYLRTLLRQVDSSLEDEWERMRDPTTGRSRRGSAARSHGLPSPRRPRRHHARREGVHRRDPDAHLHVPARLGHRRPCGRARRARRVPPPAEATPARGRLSGSDRRSKNTGSTTKASASIPRRATSGTRTSDPSDDRRTWRVQQVLVDPELHNDWMAEWEVDLAASREANQPVLALRAIGPIG